ncbi:MAG: hypothetical protein ACE5GQ_08360, partial [Nitrospinales bacterium]
LLIYNPLYAVCFAALIVGMVRTRRRVERLIYAAIAFITLFHLYLHASWYGWWLGTHTFGIRGVSMFAVLLVPALVRTITQCGERDRVLRRSLILSSVLACLWSYMLLWQGFEQFLTYRQLSAAAARWAQSLFFEPKAAVFILGFMLFLVFKKEFSPGNREPGRDLLVEYAAILLTAGSVAYLLLRGTSRLIQMGIVPTSLHPAALLALDGVEGLAALAVSIMVYCLFRKKIGAALALGRAEPWVAWGCVAVFVGTFSAFFHLAVQTENRIATGLKPDREFKYIDDFQRDEVYATYLEYLRVPGFVEKKAALREFLKANGIAPEDLPPAVPKK